MSKGAVNVSTNVVERAEREFEITIKVTQHDTAIFAGFQQSWGEGKVDGDVVEITTGAGVGSTYGVVRFKGKSYVFDARDVVGAVVENVSGRRTQVH